MGKFTGLVDALIEEYHFEHRQLAGFLHISKSAFSKHYRGKQRNTGEKYASSLEHLIAYMHEEDAKEYIKAEDERIERVDRQKMQAFIPTYEKGAIFCCGICYKQQEASEDSKECTCGYLYNVE